MRDRADLRSVAVVLAAVFVLSASLESDQDAPAAPGDEVQRLAARIRHRLSESLAQIGRYGYFEEDTEIRLDAKGLEQSRETRVYAVSPATDGGSRDSRLVSVDGRPPNPSEREDEEERRAGERTSSREEAADASRRRQEIVEDLDRGLVVRIDGRASLDGEDTTIVAFEPRPGARLQSRVARFIRALQGRVWVTAQGDIVQVDASLVDNISVGWGVIARIWKGTWLRGRQQRHEGTWLPLELTAEVQGRTLLFRTFRTRYGVKYWEYRLGAGPE
jgi:hypothetical protein